MLMRTFWPIIGVKHARGVGEGDGPAAAVGCHLEVAAERPIDEQLACGGGHGGPEGRDLVRFTRVEHPLAVLAHDSQPRWAGSCRRVPALSRPVPEGSLLFPRGLRATFFQQLMMTPKSGRMTPRA